MPLQGLQPLQVALHSCWSLQLVPVCLLAEPEAQSFNDWLVFEPAAMNALTAYLHLPARQCMPIARVAAMV